MRGGSTVGRRSKGAGAYLPTRPESLLGNCMETKHAKTATLSLTLLGGRERHWEGDTRALQMQQGELIFLIKKKKHPSLIPNVHYLKDKNEKRKKQIHLTAGKGGRGKQQMELRQPNSSRRKGKGHG